MAAPRLNYIGSKHTLLEWLTEQFKATTGWNTLSGHRVADLFGGTGAVSLHFRTLGATVYSNDAELYSSIICSAFARSIYTPYVKSVLEEWNTVLSTDEYKSFTGPITRMYSPFETCERKFFTVDNAKRIDYIRAKLDNTSNEMSADEYNFLLACILHAADAVSNVPAVYGCFLKEFKVKALKPLVLKPIHIHTVRTEGSVAFHSDVTAPGLAVAISDAELVYLDPPYNERQYSKNYFPLNVIAMSPSVASSLPIHGKTGIPDLCFASSFCKKVTVVRSFKTLIGSLNAKYIFISYNSESLLNKEEMLNLLTAFGQVHVVERDYKRFKAYEYNEDKKIKEYLYCLKRGLI